MEYVTVGSGWDSIKRKPIQNQCDQDSLNSVAKELRELAQELSAQYDRCVDKTIIRVFRVFGYTLNTLWECLCSQEWVDANNKGVDRTIDNVIRFVNTTIEETDNFGFPRCYQCVKLSKPIGVADKTNITYYNALKALWAEVETEMGR